MFQSLDIGKVIKKFKFFFDQIFGLKGPIFGQKDEKFLFF